MNVDNGHLIDATRFNELRPMFKALYEPVPAELEYAATRKLNGRPEAWVSQTSGGMLSKWANQKKKGKRALQKLARKKSKPTGL